MRPRLTFALLALAGWLSPRPAAADGAFPDSLSLLLPADRPGDIILATNFGLVLTHDGGHTWQWVCEQAIAPQARLYQIGPAPLSQLYAVAPTALVTSSDGACSWSQATGAIGNGFVEDAFPDPSDAMHVLALATLQGADTSSALALFESNDGAHTFGAPRYVAPNGLTLSGIEIARSAPRTWLLTAYQYNSNGSDPFVLQSNDAGATFMMVGLTPMIGPGAIRLIAIDPGNAGRAFLRRIASAGDSFVVLEGASASVALTLPGTMTAFLRRADGRIYVGTADAHGFVSSDGGRSFTRWAGAPHLRALAERDGVLYAAGDNYLDHFAIAASHDDGATWEPLLAFDEICGLLTCPAIQTACAGPWATLSATFGITPDSCGRHPTTASDSGCAVTRGASLGGVTGLLALVCLLWLGRRRQR
jgi:photosystem II stability/assembly factor-like uncharacterized protein